MQRAGVTFLLMLTVLVGGASSPTERSARAAAAETYLLYRPSNVPATKPAPLVVVLSGSNPAKLEVNLTGFNTVADRNGFVVAYAAFTRTYNDQARKEGLARPLLPDAQFVSDLIDNLEKSENIDPRRVYVTGVSALGTMSYRLGCQLAAKVAGIGPIAATMTVSGCNPVRPVSVLEIYGATDPYVPPDRALATAEAWRQLNGCNANPTPSQAPGAKRQTWAGCRAGSSVSLVAAEGRGHGWPRGNPWDATTNLWAFFSDHPAVYLSAKLRSARVQGKHASRRLNVSLRIDETLMIRMILSRGAKQVVAKTFRPEIGRVVLALPIPRRAASGKYILTVDLTDTRGNARSMRRAVRVPA